MLSLRSMWNPSASKARMTLAFGASTGNRGTQYNLCFRDECFRHRSIIAEDGFFSRVLQGKTNRGSNVGHGFVVCVALAHNRHAFAKPEWVSHVSGFVPLDNDLDLTGHLKSIIANAGVSRRTGAP
jgi:hypothetical protein